jgi:hypothetical protein
MGSRRDFLTAAGALPFAGLLSEPLTGFVPSETAVTEEERVYIAALDAIYTFRPRADGSSRCLEIYGLFHKAGGGAGRHGSAFRKICFLSEHVEPIGLELIDCMRPAEGFGKAAIAVSPFIDNPEPTFRVTLLFTGEGPEAFDPPSDLEDIERRNKVIKRMVATNYQTLPRPIRESETPRLIEIASWHWLGTPTSPGNTLADHLIREIRRT